MFFMAYWYPTVRTQSQTSDSPSFDDENNNHTGPGLYYSLNLSLWEYSRIVYTFVYMYGAFYSSSLVLAHEAAQCSICSLLSLNLELQAHKHTNDRKNHFEESQNDRPKLLKWLCAFGLSGYSQIYIRQYLHIKNSAFFNVSHFYFRLAKMWLYLNACNSKLQVQYRIYASYSVQWYLTLISSLVKVLGNENKARPYQDSILLQSISWDSIQGQSNTEFGF